VSRKKRLKIRRILVTAGPTREKIDPIRFISNYSTGTFGYEIAKEAKRRGARVTLVSGPTALKSPEGIKLIRVESAAQMRRALAKEFPQAGCLIMAAAVSDWRVRSERIRKIKRSGRKRLELVENPDILKEFGEKKGSRIVVGFALETENLERNALKKLINKNLDLVIANRTSKDQDVFGNGRLVAVMIDRFGNRTKVAGSKGGLAKIILDKVEGLNI